jgi:hypothetical protein
MEKTLGQMEEHRQALVKLGYFETRKFSLTRRTLDRAGMDELRSMLTNAPLSDGHWTWTATGARPSAITVTALRKDMPVWSNIFAQFDSK